MTMSAATLTRSDLEIRLLPLADRYRGKKGITIPLLADMQREMGYIAPEAVDFIAKELDIPAAELFGVATFYAMFRLQPEGRYVVRLCRGRPATSRARPVSGSSFSVISGCRRERPRRTVCSPCSSWPALAAAASRP